MGAADDSSDEVVVALRGDLDMVTLAETRSSLNPLLGASVPILDLTEVRYMDSSVLGALVEAQKVLSKRGTRMRIVTHSTSILHLFKMTGLIILCDVYHSLEEARRT